MTGNRQFNGHSVDGAVPARDRRLPDTVSAWVFDLDNTLYPVSSGMFHQVDRRIGEFISDLMSVPYDEARRIQKGYFHRYGTTLKGLMEEHGIDPAYYLEYTHDVDLSILQPDPALKTALSGLPGRRLVFTNGEGNYARRVLDRLGIAELMDGVFDIIAANYIPKPQPSVYADFVTSFDVSPTEAVYVEDMARNLVPAHEMGMTTVWLRTDYEWGEMDISRDHIHYEISDLPAWLENPDDGHATN